MDNLVNKTVNLDLTGINGNAFSVMGHFRKAAQREGWTKQEIDMVLQEAMSSDYDHLLGTILNHCDVKEEKEI